MLIPEVTTSRKELITYVIRVCKEYKIPDLANKEEKWIHRIESQLADAHYFEGLIFVKSLSPYLIFHELVHHISRLLKHFTNSTKWIILDNLVDCLDILFFKKDIGCLRILLFKL